MILPIKFESTHLIQYQISNCVMTIIVHFVRNFLFSLFIVTLVAKVQFVLLSNAC